MTNTIPPLIWAILCSALCVPATAQVIIRDQHGPNLFISGTDGDDTIFVWEQADGLMVYVNGKITNVTSIAGLRAHQIRTVGTILRGGKDFVSYQMLPEISQGTVTIGGPGNNEVVKGRGEHKGSNIQVWRTGSPNGGSSADATTAGESEHTVAPTADGTGGETTPPALEDKPLQTILLPPDLPQPPWETAPLPTTPPQPDFPSVATPPLN